MISRVEISRSNVDLYSCSFRAASPLQTIRNLIRVSIARRKYPWVLGASSYGLTCVADIISVPVPHLILTNHACVVVRRPSPSVVITSDGEIHKHK